MPQNNTRTMNNTQTQSTKAIRNPGMCACMYVPVRVRVRTGRCCTPWFVHKVRTHLFPKEIATHDVRVHDHDKNTASGTKSAAFAKRQRRNLCCGQLRDRFTGTTRTLVRVHVWFQGRRFGIAVANSADLDIAESSAQGRLNVSLFTVLPEVKRMEWMSRKRYITQVKLSSQLTAEFCS